MEILDPDPLLENLGLPYLRELATFGALSDEAILTLMREGQLWLPENGPEAQTLRRELLGLQKIVTPSGNIRFEAARGMKDDTVYSVLWACWELRNNTVAKVWGR